MDQVEEVKQKTDIVSIVGEKVKLTKAGRNYKGLCPFHSEKTPSFMVSPELQIYKCFGCGESGDALSFLQKFDGMEFYEALEFLAGKVGVKLKPISGRAQGQKERLYQLNGLVSKFYSYILFERDMGKRALSYLTQKRGLKIDTIKLFGLGFAPPKSGILANFLISKKGYKKEDLLSCGIFYQSRDGLVDRFKGRVIFGLYDHRGNSVGFAGRLMPDDKSDQAKYINTPETPVYHKSNLLYGMNVTKDKIKKNREAVIVEGELDMISSWQAGVENVVAIKGSALTEEQARLISRFSDKLTLALDSDAAGSIASKRGIGVAMKQGIEIRVADLGDYKDPDDIARKNPELYKKAIKDAVGAWEYLIEQPFKKYDSSTSIGSAKISKEVVSVLSSIPDKIVQAKLVEMAAKKLQIPSNAIYDELSGVKKKEEITSEKEAEKRSRRELLEYDLISIALHFLPEKFKEKSFRSLFKTPLYTKIVEEITKYSKKKDFKAETFSKKIPSELFQGFSDILLRDMSDYSDVKDKLEKELVSIVGEIKALNLKEKLATIALNIKRLESQGDKKKLHEAQQLFSKVSANLVNLRKNNS